MFLSPILFPAFLMRRLRSNGQASNSCLKTLRLCAFARDFPLTILCRIKFVPTPRKNSPMPTAKAYSTVSATSPLASTSIPRRDLTDHDVRIEILF